MPKKLFTQKDIADLKKQFTKDDLQLAKWLQNCPLELVLILLKILAKQFTNAVITDCFLQDHQLVVDQPLVKQSHRKPLALLFTFELKRYAAHSFHFRSKKPGYEKILNKVIKNISNLKGKSIQNSAETIQEKELFLTQMFSEDLKTKNVTTSQRMLQKSMHLVLKSAFKKLSPQIMKRFAPALGWAMLAKDVYDFGGEAVRVTTPFVVSIAFYRSAEIKKATETNSVAFK